jgi:hypothetical protein
MSVAALTSLSVNFSAFTASVPSTSSAERPSRPVEQQDDDKPRFRENTLVSAMMAAFQALGIGQTAATTVAGPATPAASPASTVPATDSAGGASGARGNTDTKGTTGNRGNTGNTGTTGTTGAAPTSTPAPDTLEKAVNEFAHALSAMLRGQGEGEHSGGESEGEHVRGHEGHGHGGYDGLVQRLEQLAQSLGGATPASSGTPAATGTTPSSSIDSTSVAPVSTSSTTAPSADPLAPSPNPRLERLLTAFTNVLNFLKPPTTTAATSPAPAAPAETLVPASSATDKLKLFLTTLAQSLNTGDQLSPVGSRVNYTV